MMIRRHRSLPVLLALALAGCAATPGPTLETDVVGVEASHLDPDFWVARAPSARREVMSTAEIRAFNADAFATDPTMVALADLPDTLPGSRVRELILAISRRPGGPRLLDGRPLTDADFAGYENALNLDGIPETVRPRFGLIVARSNLRTFPTRDRVISSPESADLDRFQEHGLFPGEAVAVLHESADGDWLFVQSYNYAAWLEKAAVAVGKRQDVFEFLSATDFVVVTGSKVFTNFNPRVPAVSELQLDMGVRLPLVSAAEAGHDVHGQNPYASHVVRLPVRASDGGLVFEHALIARSQDVQRGYLPYTRENVIRQAFKFLGERYGWGHSYNGRDCTGFVSEVYKTFGLLMPRNSGDQGASDIGGNRRFADGAAESDKLAALADLQPGSLVYIPGHVAMHIGDVGGKPYVIHDVTGLAYIDDNGDFYRGVLAGVSVTPLLPLRVSAERRYLDRIYNIKTLY